MLCAPLARLQRGVEAQALNDARRIHRLRRAVHRLRLCARCALFRIFLHPMFFPLAALRSTQRRTARPRLTRKHHSFHAVLVALEQALQRHVALCTSELAPRLRLPVAPDTLRGVQRARVARGAADDVPRDHIRRVGAPARASGLRPHFVRGS